MGDLAPKPDAMKPVADGMIELLLTLSPAQYEAFGPELEALRRKLDAPSNMQTILEAVRRQNAAMTAPNAGGGS